MLAQKQHPVTLTATILIHQTAQQKIKKKKNSANITKGATPEVTISHNVIYKAPDKQAF